jgi:hypothetical protein
MKAKEREEWLKIKEFIDAYLEKDVSKNDVTTTIMEALSGLVVDLYYMTLRANCNCINHDEYEELNEDAEELKRLLNLLGLDMKDFIHGNN